MDVNSQFEYWGNVLTELGTPIAFDRTADIYPWNNGQIIKLFHTWRSCHDSDREVRVSRDLWAVGFPAPAVGDLIEVEGRRGLLYVRLDGPTVVARAISRPWTLRRSVRDLADLHVDIYGRECDAALPVQMNRLREHIVDASTMCSDLRERALRTLRAGLRGRRVRWRLSPRERYGDFQGLCHH